MSLIHPEVGDQRNRSGKYVTWERRVDENLKPGFPFRSMGFKDNLLVDIILSDEHFGLKFLVDNFVLCRL